MQRSADEGAIIKAEFKSRRFKQILLAIPLVALILGIALTQDEANHTLFGLPEATALPAFLAIVAGALVFSFRNWRCPACSKYLGKQMNPKYCHACGVELR